MIYCMPQPGDLYHAQLYTESPLAKPRSATYDSYDVLITSLYQQYEAIVSHGITMTLSPVGETLSRHLFHTIDSGNPVPVLATNTAGDIDDDSPMAQPSPYYLNDNPIVNNDIFRFVHDVMGHYLTRSSFSPEGEFKAWIAHGITIPLSGHQALFLETRGQNEATNFSHGNHHLPRNERPFAPQRIADISLRDIYIEPVIARMKKVCDGGLFSQESLRKYPGLYRFAASS